MDAQRAMREARYAQRVTRPTVAPSPVAPVAPATRTPSRATARTQQPATQQPATDQPATADTGLCGHRAISGRTCTREQGHTAKSHRYA